MEVKCAKCMAVLVERGTVSTWKDLPREGWAELMDLWHCHKPDDEDGQGDGLVGSGKGYAAGNRLVARRGTGFVDVIGFLLRREDCVGVEVSCFAASCFASCFSFLFLSSLCVGVLCLALCECCATLSDIRYFVSCICFGQQEGVFPDHLGLTSHMTVESSLGTDIRYNCPTKTQSRHHSSTASVEPDEEGLSPESLVQQCCKLRGGASHRFHHRAVEESNTWWDDYETHACPFNS